MLAPVPDAAADRVRHRPRGARGRRLRARGRRLRAQAGARGAPRRGGPAGRGRRPGTRRPTDDDAIAGRARRRHPVRPPPTSRYVEAQGDYARLHTADGLHLVRTPLATLEDEWAGRRVRPHPPLAAGRARARRELRMDSGRCTRRRRRATASSRSAAGTPASCASCCSSAGRAAVSRDRRRRAGPGHRPAARAVDPRGAGRADDRRRRPGSARSTWARCCASSCGWPCGILLRAGAHRRQCCRWLFHAAARSSPTSGRSASPCRGCCSASPSTRALLLLGWRLRAAAERNERDFADAGRSDGRAGLNAAPRHRRGHPGHRRDAG